MYIQEGITQTRALGASKMAVKVLAMIIFMLTLDLKHFSMFSAFFLKFGPLV